jgi:hypothetical protein
MLRVGQVADPERGVCTRNRLIALKIATSDVDDAPAVGEELRRLDQVVWAGELRDLTGSLRDGLEA